MTCAPRAGEHRHGSRARRRGGGGSGGGRNGVPWAGLKPPPSPARMRSHVRPRPRRWRRLSRRLAGQLPRRPAPRWQGSCRAVAIPVYLVAYPRQ
eukprot:354903-Chlamydomonas_euryale.AAC.19